MTTHTPPRAAPPAEEGGRAARLSGRTVGQAEPAEQFLLWALRQRLAAGEDGAASPVLAHGFRLAFGLAGVEGALAAFEGVFQALSRRPRRDIALCPLRCACVSVDEEAVLRLAAAAQAGHEAWLEAAGLWLVEPTTLPDLCRHARGLAAMLREAGLALPLRPGPAPAAVRASLH